MPVDSDEDRTLEGTAVTACFERIVLKPPEATCYMAAAFLRDTCHTWSEVLACKLLTLARQHRKRTPLTSGMRSDPQPRCSEVEPAVLQSNTPPAKSNEVALVTTTGAEGALDTGASRTVVGSDRVREAVEGLDAKCRAGVRKVASSINSRFGNSGDTSAQTCSACAV